MEEGDTSPKNPFPDPILLRFRLSTSGGGACLTLGSQPEAPFPSVHHFVRFPIQTDPFIDRFHLCLCFSAMLRYQLSATELGRDVTFVRDTSSERAGLVPRLTYLARLRSRCNVFLLFPHYSFDDERSPNGLLP